MIGLEKYQVIGSYMKGRIDWQGLKQSEFTKNPDDPFLITGMNFKDGQIRWDEVYHIADERYNEAPEIQLKQFDVLMTKDGTIGKLLYMDFLPGKTSLNSHLLVLRPLNKDYFPKYLYYQLQSQPFLHFVELNKTGTTFYGLSQEAMGEYKIILPPIEEQTTIANFLDEKTTQIDKLISNKQKLIELLKEERTAIINEAVSGKGKNWERKKLKYVALIKYGLGQPPKQMDDGLPLIRATNVERGKINEKDLVFVDPDDVPYDRDPVLKENDIIVVRSGAYTADSAIIPKKFEGAITGYDMVVRVVDDNPFYIAFCLLSDDVLINQLYLQRLRAAHIHYLQTETKRIDNTISKIDKEIELMNEYRTALISEVVTGKVKVIDNW
ncbi:MAG: restriction endonuclease subunit S [Bacteroidia bacterium]|nr:restriction endonuclease subunit S [Bacteroidia bacterium]